MGKATEVGEGKATEVREGEAWEEGWEAWGREEEWELWWRAEGSNRVDKSAREGIGLEARMVKTRTDTESESIVTEITEITTDFRIPEARKSTELKDRNRWRALTTNRSLLTRSPEPTAFKGPESCVHVAAATRGAGPS